MSWDRGSFVEAYVAAGLSPDSARSYCTYLKRADGITGGLDELVDRLGWNEAIQTIENYPIESWGSAKNRKDSLSAVRWYCLKMPERSKGMPRYHINVFWSKTEARWIAGVPDLAGCSANGETAAEAVSEVEIAIESWLETARRHGDPLPKPRYNPAIYAAGP